MGGGAFAWLGSGGSSAAEVIDSVTGIFSHELVEAVSDTRDLGVRVDPGPYWTGNVTDKNELADYEPDGTYFYRYHGTKVQAYWSQAAGAFIVPTTGLQNFYLTGDSLEVDGDQLGTGGPDDITLATDAYGNLAVTVNGETATFDAAWLSTVTVLPKAGHNTISIQGVPYGIAVTVRSTSNDTVTVGKAGDTSAVVGTMTLTNTAAATDLTVDDSADTANGVVALSANYIDLAGGQVNVSGAALNSLLIKCGPGPGGLAGNSIDVTDTPANATGLVTTLHTGAGYDRVRVTGTTGPLVIDGDGGNDNVTIGEQPAPLTNTLANINGDVTIRNTGGHTVLSLDDRDDLTWHGTVTVTGTAVTGLAPATINYDGTGLRSLTITGSAVTTEFDVESTPAVPVQITGGSNGITVNVCPTSRNIDAIQGTLYLDGDGPNSLTIYDQAGTADGTTYAVSGYALQRDSRPSITYHALRSPSGFGRVEIFAGAGSNVINVTGAVAGQSLTIDAGGGDDKVYVTPDSNDLG